MHSFELVSSLFLFTETIHLIFQFRRSVWVRIQDFDERGQNFLQEFAGTDHDLQVAFNVHRGCK